MTGFGRFREATEQRTIEVEARSVNHRFLKLQIRLPRDLARLEPEVEAEIKKVLQRGSVSVTIRNEELADSNGITLDQELAAQLNAQAKTLARTLGMPEQDLTLDALVALPGVVRTSEPSDTLDEERKAAVLGALNHALESLVNMRRTEGATLAEELRLIHRRIVAAVQEVKERAPVVVEEYARKLQKRLNHLLTQFSDKVAATDSDILREVALFADRADISEELQRLESHLEQFTGLLNGDEVGRKLDFLLQEMLRETNTIASKASDSAIARHVIEIKTDLERLREQAQNIE